MTERRKIALLIGNNDYESQKLLNCVNDVEDLAFMLEKYGFNVQLEKNLKSEDMKMKIESFIKSIIEGDFILFFFAGHGRQWEDQNYLMPCDDNFGASKELKFRATRAQNILEQMSNKNPYVIIYFLDCCRDYWLSSMARGRAETSSSKGMCEMHPVAGSVIVFACAPGKTAKDISLNGRNGVFTYHLLQHIGKPGENILMLTIDVTNGVRIETNGAQVPHTTHNLTDRYICIVSPSKIVHASTTITLDETGTTTQFSDVQDNVYAAMATGVANNESNYINEQVKIPTMEINPRIKRVPLRGSSRDIPSNATWKQKGIIVAGGNSQGSKTDQLNTPSGLYVDDDQTVYVADQNNHRIIAWKPGAKKSQVVAGGNGQGKRADKLNHPFDVIVDKDRDSLIISDFGNHRVVLWSLRNGSVGETIISNINCIGLTMDDNGFLYVVDNMWHVVRRYRIGNPQGTVVAGFQGYGDGRGQLSNPFYVFVDRDRSVYVSEDGNDRVTKWEEGAKEGIIVAGNQDRGSDLNQLSSPRGVVVDQLGTVYVADEGNHRVMCWQKGTTEGKIICGGNGSGPNSNQLDGPRGLSFDQNGNLYVVNSGTRSRSHRKSNCVQLFSLQ